MRSCYPNFKAVILIKTKKIWRYDCLAFKSSEQTCTDMSHRKISVDILHKTEHKDVGVKQRKREEQNVR